MGPTIAATVYGVFALVAAWIFRPRVIDAPAILRGAIFWLFSVPIMFLIPLAIANLVACGVLLVLLTPRQPADRASFYFIVLLAVPIALRTEVPFPGINYLMILDFAKVAFLAVLAPALLTAPAPAARKHAPAAGIFIIALTLLYFLQEFRSENLTTSLRQGVDHFLLYAAPFLALIRIVNDERSFDKIFTSFLFVAVVFFFAALLSQFTRWNYYTYLIERAGEFMFADVRFGILRVSVTGIPIVVGYIMVLGWIAVEYFREERRLSFITAWFYRAIFALAAFFTYARGAWLAGLVGIAAYLFFTKFPRALRPMILALTMILAFPAVVIYFLTADLDQYDVYGTFEYRQELLYAAWRQFQESPLFGDPRFLQSEHLQHMYQGQGIIDVVNLYVGIALRHGLVGLSLYMGAFGFALAGLLSLGRAWKGRAGMERQERQRAVLLSIVISYLVMMATVSGVSFTLHIGVFILAVSTAFIASSRAREQERRFEIAAPAAGDLHAA